MVRHKRYQGSWERLAFHLTPEYLDQVAPIIKRFLKGKPGCKTYAQMQYWVDARQVITEVNHRIHHPEDQRFREEDLEELTNEVKGGTDQPIFTIGTVFTDCEYGVTTAWETANGKGKKGISTATNRVIKWNGS